MLHQAHLRGMPARELDIWGRASSFIIVGRPNSRLNGHHMRLESRRNRCTWARGCHGTIEARESHAHGDSGSRLYASRLAVRISMSEDLSPSWKIPACRWRVSLNACSSMLDKADILLTRDPWLYVIARSKWIRLCNRL